MSTNDMNTNTNNTKRNKTNVAPGSNALATFHHNSSDWSKLLSSGVRVFIRLSTGACRIYCCSMHMHRVVLEKIMIRPDPDI